MNDKLRDLLGSTIEDAVTKNFDQMAKGQNISGIMKTLEATIASEKVVPAVATKKVDGGVVFVTTPETLLNKTAAELRSDGLIVSGVVPDCASVRRAKSGQLVFVWKPVQIIDVNNPPNS